MLVNPRGAAGWGLASRASAVPLCVLQGSSLLSTGWGVRRDTGLELAPHLFLFHILLLSFPHLMEKSDLAEEQAPGLRDSSPLLGITFCNISPTSCLLTLSGSYPLHLHYHTVPLLLCPLPVSLHSWSIMN